MNLFQKCEPFSKIFEKYTYSVDDFKSSSAVRAGLTIRQSRQSA